ncbi:hypothetical protein VB780_10490 [Leptolyngbya sp. CCNP1308]|uniref:hypothetical protein n=1 Tax=Leptolyngbya sp. CCNP1308 TaxID=3110255 RepID=UPI002B217053|nr:hypothetical protein [Leptolyngbya sp. CCNP1308]MEA5448997.1 hypothetical protein [Leptolyngbya sp. CCNP1308]
MNNTTQPWDMAGADGLVAARALFGEAIDHLAPFQSMETELEGLPCAVLRLCDRNFRLTYPGPLDRIVAELQLNLWVKQLTWMDVVVLPPQSSTIPRTDEGCPSFLAQASVRAPHRLHGLPLHCAVPAQISALPVLIWHHPIEGQPALELHLAKPQIENLWRLIQSFSEGSVSLTTAHT